MSGNTNLQFGRRPGGSIHFGGELDDIRIYDRSLSDSEVEDLYDLEKPTHALDSVNDISLWLDATNIDGKQNTTLTNGSNVSEWKDLSGNENNAISLTNGSSLVLSSQSDFGDKSVIKFDDDTTTVI